MLLTSRLICLVVAIGRRFSRFEKTERRFGSITLGSYHGTKTIETGNKPVFGYLSPLLTPAEEAHFRMS